MRLAQLSVVSMFLLSMSAACGDDGGGGGNVDAPVVVVDAPMIDAPAALTGIGQRCGQGGTACPASAPVCLVATMNGPGMCTMDCVASSTFTTNAQMVPGAFTPDPAAQDGACDTAYTGTVGTGSCSFPYNLMPAHSPLMANTTYTVKFGCAIDCGAGNTCPSGLTCNTQIMQCRVM